MVAASLLGMLLFLRVDMVIAVAGFVAAAAIGRMAGLPAVVGFFPTLVVWLAAAGLYLLGLMQPYMWIPLIWLRSLPVWQMALGVVSALAVLIVVFAGAQLPAVRRLLPWVWKVLAVVAVALVIYAYFFRVAAGRLAEHDAIALRSFAWYVMPLGLFTALVGYVAALRRFAARDSVFLLTFSLYATFVFYKIRIVPVHYWTTRRFLPIILPGAMLLAAYAAFGRWREDDRGWRYQLRAAAGVVVIAILAVQFWTRSAPLFGHVEYAGVIPRLEKLAQTFGDKDLVIVESRDASDVHVLALPLAYIYARNVLLLPNRRPDAATMERFIAWARQQYATVYFVGGGGTELLTKAIAVEPIGTEVFQVPEWSSAWNALPDGARRKEFDFSVYRFIDPPATAAGAVALDVGVNDDVNVLRFHAKERHANGTTFRWSRDVSYINLQGVTADDRTITLVMDDGTPAGPGAAGLGRDLDERSGAGTRRRRPRLQALRGADSAGAGGGRGIERHAGAAEARDQRLAAEGRARRARRSRSRRHGRSRGREIAGLLMADLQIYDPRERRIVAAADRRAGDRRRRGAAVAAPRAGLAAAAHPAAAPRADRRSADVGGGHRVGAGARAGGGDRSRGRQLEPIDRRAPPRHRSRRDARRAVAGARRRRGRDRAPDVDGVELARARLRSGHQLRGRRAQPRADRAGRRPPARRLRDGRRRSAPDRRRRAPSRSPHRGQRRRARRRRLSGEPARSTPAPVSGSTCRRRRAGPRAR